MKCSDVTDRYLKRFKSGHTALY